ncbi:MAG TPA: hypothetical protein PLY90_02220 [Candidatus Hydrogenedentes bacterium]|nr:hypothetical protein [Candidatus Hydrogenedentota bacterium]HOD94598.1 hypothetical protein [Candidatus Hydrogenedentota bacterium]HOR50805.1 hypothetical protein [Candidatus Hydrogenedentota bacterium]HPX87244.1 hypothetical protein [Candidatus Hydrogenedentota bacterium]HQB02088.1 hypothetical protein [Candidatus Hydrogenedentota bacterium]
MQHVSPAAGFVKSGFFSVFSGYACACAYSREVPAPGVNAARLRVSRPGRQLL